MGKEDTIAAQKAAITQAQDQALTDGLGACYDQGAQDQKASDGTLTQADIDAAVTAAVSPLNDQITQLQAQVQTDAQTLEDAQAKAQSEIDATKQALADMTAKEQLEEQAVADVGAKIQQVQAAFDAIRSLLVPPQQ